MDLNSIFTGDAHEAGADMVVKDIHGEKTDITLRLRGIHSRAWRNITNRRDRQIIAGVPVDEQITEEEMLAAVTAGWENMPDPRPGENYGELLEFSEEHARMIYEKAPLIFDQVNRFVANHANFTNA